jgi:hypothetical protein
VRRQVDERAAAQIFRERQTARTGELCELRWTFKSSAVSPSIADS